VGETLVGGLLVIAGGAEGPRQVAVPLVAAEPRLLLCRNTPCYGPALTSGRGKQPIASKPCKSAFSNYA
jgi:hypothetical protein